MTTWSTPGIWIRPREQRAEAEHRHRHPHRPLALGDVVLGAREADVGVLGLAGRGLIGSAWCDVPALELLRLLARRAGDHPEADPERVEGGQQRADVAADREDPVHAAAVGGEGEDLVLGEEAGGAREGGEREAADDQQRAR